MAASLAACGSSSSSSTTAAATEAASKVETTAAASKEESTEAASKAAAAEDLTANSADWKLAEAGKLHMATNAAFPPYESTTDNGGYEGIDVEIATAIADKLGLELAVDDMDFSSVITSVASGKSDIAMAGLTVNEERKQNLDFTDSYQNAVQSIIVKDDSEIKTADDLGNANAIGCQEGTTGYIYCSDSYGDKAIAYQDGATAVQALVQGKVDAVVIDNEPAKAYVAANQGLKILDTPFEDEDYAIGVAKGNTELLKSVNGALEQLQQDGTVKKIVDKYITE
ncbi:transporter substrate-binding domain-containing protein [Clostridium vitabionis]|uniref:transporter substrate-binding domain-containing protein n=1 Tax=Clostridium vitabionis TaxID=2784388 RepID=UPI001F22F62B|nr:transporter substrate-binding domain-containing protein [Clostridium vitabionis]